MHLDRKEGRLTGTLLMGDGPEMTIAWAFVTGQHLSVSAVDPRGQLEILWLTGDLDSLTGPLDPDELYRTPLTSAARAGHLDVVRNVAFLQTHLPRSLDTLSTSFFWLMDSDWVY